MKIRTQSVHFTADKKLLALIEKKLEKLEQFFDKIIGAEVVLRLENNSSKLKDKMVEIKLNIPNYTLIAKDTSKVFEKSADTAVESLRRQLIKVKEKSRER